MYSLDEDWSLIESGELALAGWWNGSGGECLSAVAGFFPDVQYGFAFGTNSLPRFCGTDRLDLFLHLGTVFHPLCVGLFHRALWMDP